MTTSVRRYIIDRLKDKTYRDAYVDENISTGIATQIKTMRESCGWTQQELGARLGMAQETISQLEDPNYGRLTMRTLKRLASAFDVALFVRFVPFSSLVDMLVNLSQEDLAVPSFEKDVLVAPTYPVSCIMASSGQSWSIQSTEAREQRSVPLVNRTLAQGSNRSTYECVSSQMAEPIPA